jgi:hypothetical protein
VPIVAQPSSLSRIRPEASAAGAGHSLHSCDLGPVPVVPGGGVIPNCLMSPPQLRRRRYRVHSNLSGRFQNRKPRV